MKDLTLDACVLFDASGNGLSSQYGCCRRLMQGMKEVLGAMLALDTEELIISQYKRKMDPQAYGLQWVKQMASMDKVQRVDRARIDRKTRVQLEEAHLDREDYKYYVRTAASTACKRLVSRDKDYSFKIQKILKKKLAVRVSDAPNACRYLDR